MVVSWRQVISRKFFTCVYKLRLPLTKSYGFSMEFGVSFFFLLLIDLNLLQANNMGVGVVGIIECNFLKPTHNKQDFDYTNEYR